MRRSHATLSLVVATLGLTLMRCADSDVVIGGGGAPSVAGATGSSGAGAKSGNAGKGGGGGGSGEEVGGAGAAGAAEGGATGSEAGETGAAGTGIAGGATGGGSGTVGTSGTSGESASGTSGGGTSGASASAGGGGSSGAAPFAAVRAIFNARCSSCHGAGYPRVVLDASLSDAALRSKLVNPLLGPLPTCEGEILVTPGDASPAASKLIAKLTQDKPTCGAFYTSRMPNVPNVGACTTAAGNCLGELEIATIVSWINGGASL